MSRAACDAPAIWRAGSRPLRSAREQKRRAQRVATATDSTADRRFSRWYREALSSFKEVDSFQESELANRRCDLLTALGLDCLLSL